MPGISANLSIRRILKEHPAAKKVFEKHGMMCLKCKGFENETLRNAAQNHGVPLPLLLEEIERALKSGK